MGIERQRRVCFVFPLRVSRAFFTYLGLQVKLVRNRLSIFLHLTYGSDRDPSCKSTRLSRQCAFEFRVSLFLIRPANGLLLGESCLDTFLHVTFEEVLLTESTQTLGFNE
jgi:hypothetical protein